MADGISGILKDLRRMREGIEEAILALERVERVEMPVPSGDAPVISAADGTNRRSEAQKARWAAKKKIAKKAAAVTAPVESEPVATATAPTAKRRGAITEEGRKKLAAAMRKRWAVAKAAGTTPVKAAKKGRKSAA